MARRTRGSGSLGKRGGVWWIKYPDGFGHAYRESSHCKNKADAERLLKVRLGEVAAGKAHHPISRKTTVADVLQAVEQYYDDNGYSSTPQVRSRIKNHLLPFFGHRRVGDIGTEDLKRYRQSDFVNEYQELRSTAKWRCSGAAGNSAGIAENVIMKIAGWKTNSMFRRYDIVDHRDLRDASRQMEQFLADSRRQSLGTTLGTVDGCTPNTSSSDGSLFTENAVTKVGL